MTEATTTPPFKLEAKLIPLLTDAVSGKTAKFTLSGGRAVLNLDGDITVNLDKSNFGIDFGKSLGGTFNFNDQGELVSHVLDAPPKHKQAGRGAGCMHSPFEHS